MPFARSSERPAKTLRLRRYGSGDYGTRDGRFRVFRWDNQVSDGKVTWAIHDNMGNDFVCEVLTLHDARRYLSGDGAVFILS